MTQTATRLDAARQQLARHEAEYEAISFNDPECIAKIEAVAELIAVDLEIVRDLEASPTT